jgi:hypothetical protein
MDQKGYYFIWDEVKKEICHHLAGNKWKDHDFTGVTAEHLVNDPQYKAWRNELRTQLEDAYVLESVADREQRLANEKPNSEPQMDAEVKRIEEEKQRNADKKRLAEEKKQPRKGGGAASKG